MVHGHKDIIDTSLQSYTLFIKKTLADTIILWLLNLGITMLIHNKDDIVFVTEFPWFLGQPVHNRLIKIKELLSVISSNLPF